MYGNYDYGPGMMGGWHDWAGAGAPAWALGLFAFLGPLIVIVVLWSILWKGLALWHAARQGHPWWFVIMLIVNTAGILEIIYLFGILKLKFGELFSFKEHHHNH
ncbi:MAG TPA: DUF5652 family protein [Candidatus Paceibacterota bacterium]